jgi:hypothetical protein
LRVALDEAALGQVELVVVDHAGAVGQHARADLAFSARR